MDLFKFLKKKKVDSFEMLLQKAADSPSYRTEFIERILNEKLTVITKDQVGSERFIKVEAGTKIKVYTLADGRIPVFTSPQRVYDKGIFKGEANIFEAKGEDIFTLFKGATLILNPYSDYGKKFNPDEIERILNGTYFKSRQIVVKESTQVRLGQPAKYPTKVVESLIGLFSSKPDVIKAYLGWIHDPATVDPPHYIFAIETKGDWLTLSDDAGYLVQQILGPEEIVDFLPIKHGGGIEDYFIKTTPFYVNAAAN